MRPLALTLVLLALTATAEERYVPIAVGTELQITNASSQRSQVTIELLGSETVRLDIDAGETIRWTAPADEGVLRIDGDAEVTAVSRRTNARMSLPVVAARDVADEVDIPRRGAWRSGVLAINASEATAFVVIDDTLHTIAPRGTLRVDGTSTVRAKTPLLLFTYDANDANGARVFTPVAPDATRRRRRAVRSITPSPTPKTQTITLTASKDNTLFETLNGTISNGAGHHLFFGRIRTGGKRRAVMAFDVAGQIPPGAVITKVTLTMTVTRTVSGTEPATLHRVTKDWGEGTSNAGSTADGSGASAAPNDATWLHTFFPDTRWTTAGGDFETTPDATASVASATGVWTSAAMIARVQQWLDQPATNFGWIILGNESRSSSVKRVNSRNTPAAFSLSIEFQTTG